MGVEVSLIDDDMYIDLDSYERDKEMRRPPPYTRSSPVAV
jgi:hypothetical protein